MSTTAAVPTTGTGAGGESSAGALASTGSSGVEAGRSGGGGSSSTGGASTSGSSSTGEVGKAPGGAGSTGEAQQLFNCSAAPATRRSGCCRLRGLQGAGARGLPGGAGGGARERLRAVPGGLRAAAVRLLAADEQQLLLQRAGAGRVRGDLSAAVMRWWGGLRRTSTSGSTQAGSWWRRGLLTRGETGVVESRSSGAGRRRSGPGRPGPSQRSRPGSGKITGMRWGVWWGARVALARVVRIAKWRVTSPVSRSICSREMPASTIVAPSRRRRHSGRRCAFGPLGSKKPSASTPTRPARRRRGSSGGWRRSRRGR